MGTETAADEQQQHASERLKGAGEVVTEQKGKSCNPSTTKGLARQQGNQVPTVSPTMAQGLCSVGPHEVRGGGRTQEEQLKYV